MSSLAVIGFSLFHQQLRRHRDIMPAKQISSLLTVYFAEKHVDGSPEELYSPSFHLVFTNEGVCATEPKNHLQCGRHGG
jgi:hypothetical protein